MGLDFSLHLKGECVFANNITHNLNTMAEEANIYMVLWRPEEIGITKAHQCIELLSNGLLNLIQHRTEFEKFNSPNGWGMYEHFVPFVTSVLQACCDNPDADVEASR